MEDLAGSYDRAGFTGRLALGQRPALLVVDIARAYTDPSSPLYTSTPAVTTRIAELRRMMYELGAPVVFTRVRFQRGGVDGGLYYRKVPALRCFEDGSPLADFPDQLKPGSNDLVVTKQYASAFYGTALAGNLTALGIDTLIITGYSTSGCVRATAVDALQHGFVPVVVEDAVGDRHPTPHQANLFDLKAKYAEVETTDFVINWLRSVGPVPARTLTP